MLQEFLIKKVLVTGASGFLGSHISEAAHDAGYEVHALIRQTSSRRWLKHDWLNIHVANLDDRCGLSGVLKGMDAVIHNAGATSGFSEEDFQHVNVEGTRTVVEESIKAGVKRFVYISSQAAGGPGKGPFPKTEDDPDCPVSAYGRSKKKAEELLYSLRDKIEVVSLRYPAIYGPRGKEMLPVFKLAGGIIQPLIGMKPLYTSMVYVTDAARAAVAAAKAKLPSGSIYYITDGIDYTVEYLYDQIGEALGRRGMRIRLSFWLVSLAAWWTHEVRGEQTSFTREKVREFKARYWLASSERAMRELDWRPQVLPQEGFAKTIRWYRYKRWL
ncbi:NAD(P)-dependent oxidoreductase [candidate division WOR-3 bacterium]|nr:NAD(P)-dependent oxidoreductase [candidate division WOR-3 bacterium]